MDQLRGRGGRWVVAAVAGLVLAVGLPADVQAATAARGTGGDGGGRPTATRALLHRVHSLLLPRSATGAASRAAVPPRLTEPRYEVKPMLPVFRLEGWRVRQLNAKKRERYRVYFDGEGLLRSARDGSLFDTTEAVSPWGAPGYGRAIFVMDGYGNIYASNYQQFGKFHHSSFLAGEPTGAAGELAVIQGRAQDADGSSGHYRHEERFMKQFADELARHRVHGVPIYDHRHQLLFHT